MIACGIRSRIFFCLVIFFTNCAKNPINSNSANSTSATWDTNAKHQFIELSQSKKLNELSEMERIKFIEEMITYIETIELVSTIKDNCYENKDIENSSNCFELRAQCSNSIRMNDSILNEFRQRLPEISSCLNEQFTQSNILLNNVVNSFKAFIDFMETMINELDCPASWEQFNRIAEKVSSRYADEGEKKMQYASKVDILFYPCLHKYILR